MKYIVDYTKHKKGGHKKNGFYKDKSNEERKGAESRRIVRKLRCWKGYNQSPREWIFPGAGLVEGKSITLSRSKVTA